MQGKLIIIRKSNNITQKALAQLLHISEVQYGKKEKGRVEFTQDEMFTISDFFNMKIDDIFLPRNATKCC